MRSDCMVAQIYTACLDLVGMDRQMIIERDTRS